MSERQPAKRVLDAWTSGPEKRALIWMAGRLPGWVTPDHLTILGLLSGPVVFIGYALTRLSRWWILLADAGIALHWWADSMDGTLARVRHRERERYGYFVDHLSDAWTVPVMGLGLASAGITRLDVALALAATYLMLNIFVHVSAYARGVYKITFGRVGPTEIRVILILASTLFVFWNPVLLQVGRQAFKTADVIGLAFCAVLQVVLAVAAVRSAMVLDREDRARWAS